MSVSIERFGPHATGAVFERALELRRTLTAEYDPELDPDTEDLFRASLSGTTTFELRAVAALLDGEVLGIAVVELHHLKTNTDKAIVEIEVHPEHRRRGLGTALLDAVLDIAESNGRTSIAGINVSGPDAVGFWNAMGAEQRLIDRQSRLKLADTDETLMHDWVAGRRQRAGDYRLEHFRGLTPDHLLAAAAHLNGAMSDAPLDGLEWERDVWTEDDVLQLDELIIGRGRDRWTTIVLGPDDAPAGLTTISTQFEKPRFAHQGNTAVDHAHRNRGIGRWLKADMYFRLRADAPEVVAIDTDNAESNDPMLAINDQMGFRPLVDWANFQADASVLREHTASRRAASD